MTYCVNSQCASPQNSADCKTCQTCGYGLLLNGKYTAIKKIGAGGFGRTFLAVDCSRPAKPRCVIKQLFLEGQNTHNRTKAVELFRQEAEQLNRLGQHPQIPDCLDSFEDGKHQYIIQEFVDGNNLDQQLRSKGLFTETQVFKLLMEILPVLEFIHQKGVIHRDIKPANIIYCQTDNSLWLVDLGAAKQLTGTALARTGTVIGSAEYTAPEQVRGKATFGSDIYSLGVTCIYLLTGLSPFNLYDTGDSRWVWQDFLSKSINPDLANLLDKMIQMSTNKRYQTIQDVQVDLAKINLQENLSDIIDEMLRESSATSGSEKATTRFAKSDSPASQKLSPELQKEKAQSAPLEISAEQPGNLAAALTDNLICFLQSLRLPTRQARGILLLFSFSAFAFFVYASNTTQVHNNPSHDLENSEVNPSSFEDASHDSYLEYLETSADWEIKTYLYPRGHISTGVAQHGSQVGFDTLYTNSEGIAVTWNLELPFPQEPTVKGVSDIGLVPKGFFGKYAGKPLVMDQDNQLKILDILTGETSLVPDPQNFFRDRLNIADLNALLIVNSTKTHAYSSHYSQGDSNTFSIKRIWDIESGEILAAKSNTEFWQLVSHDNIFPFSPDGNWALLPNGENLGFELWDLKAQKRVKTIQASAASFTPNKNILLLEEHVPLGELSKIKLFDLNTQKYLRHPASIKVFALHPSEEKAAMFDGNNLFIGSTLNFSRQQLTTIGEYSRVQYLKFSPDGKILAGMLGEDPWDIGELIFWDAKTGKVLEEPQKIGGLNLLRDPILQFSLDSQKLLIKTDDGTSTTDENFNKETWIQIWQVPQPLKQ
ncbi:MAG: WD40 repeat domain-containing serine/threonine protein kinase [Cyanobacteria bacterium P01_C01_bin.118]